MFTLLHEAVPNHLPGRLTCKLATKQDALARRRKYYGYDNYDSESDHDNADCSNSPDPMTFPGHFDDDTPHEVRW